MCPECRVQPVQLLVAPVSGRAWRRIEAVGQQDPIGSAELVMALAEIPQGRSSKFPTLGRVSL